MQLKPETDSHGVAAWHEKQAPDSSQTNPVKTIYELLSQPPFAAPELQIERQKDCPRPVEL